MLAFNSTAYAQCCQCIAIHVHAPVHSHEYESLKQLVLAIVVAIVASNCLLAIKRSPRKSSKMRIGIGTKSSPQEQQPYRYSPPSADIAAIADIVPEIGDSGSSTESSPQPTVYNQLLATIPNPDGQRYQIENTPGVLQLSPEQLNSRDTMANFVQQTLVAIVLEIFSPTAQSNLLLASVMRGIIEQQAWMLLLSIIAAHNMLLPRAETAMRWRRLPENYPVIMEVAEGDGPGPNEVIQLLLHEGDDPEGAASGSGGDNGGSGGNGGGGSDGGVGGSGGDGGGGGGNGGGGGGDGGGGGGDGGGGEGIPQQQQGENIGPPRSAKLNVSVQCQENQKVTIKLEFGVKKTTHPSSQEA